MLGTALERTSLNMVRQFRWMTQLTVCSWVVKDPSAISGDLYYGNRPKMEGGCCNYQYKHFILFVQTPFLIQKRISLQTWWHGHLETCIWKLPREYQELNHETLFQRRAEVNRRYCFLISGEKPPLFWIEFSKINRIEF